MQRHDQDDGATHLLDLAESDFWAFVSRDLFTTLTGCLGFTPLTQEIKHMLVKLSASNTSKSSP